MHFWGQVVKVNKKKLAEIFGRDVRTITTWKKQGLPLASGGGKGAESIFDTKVAIEWYAQRDVDIETEKIRKKLTKLEEELQSLGLGYEEKLLIARWKLTEEQAVTQKLKNQVAEEKMIDTDFCVFFLSRLAMYLSSTLDAIPLAMQRKFPDMPPQQIAHLKTLVAKGTNQCAKAGEKLPATLYGVEHD
ncbi:terminase small subunit [Salmonella enterica]|nr:terminase small subunit [Salmonella enterica]EBS0795539.1 terminase small subunit [Salmonella enterica subsp. enterica serovar Overschie]EBZ5139784.1 terminase small subunit [Salmonella enterica subsp. enterica serovar Antsalova]ECB6428416.1 terminase small subunit [Salmonella enterica subsp. enterica serovar Adelaide]ECU7994679.1 terminase small subunit [Salmonella enterica subsp. enterica serovar Toucra]EHI8599435.1 terminase small subunit [Salmonella enterica subsp. enterica serovar 51:z